MNTLEKFKFTNYQTKFILPILPLLNLFPNKVKHHNQCLYSILENYDTVSVLGSGPSLKKINLDNNENEIYLTTNSSYLALKGKRPFIHLISDHGYLLKFLLFGLKYQPELTIIVSFTSKKPIGLSGKILNQVNNYLYRVKRKSPIVIINNHKLGVANNRDYLTQMADFKKSLNVQFNYSNSGHVIYTLGAMLLENQYINKLKIYGIDAGEGGLVHFDGRKTSDNHSAFRDKNKKEMGDFFELCQSKFKHIKNYSYFKNNTDETT